MIGICPNCWGVLTYYEPALYCKECCCWISGWERGSRWMLVDVIEGKRRYSACVANIYLEPDGKFARHSGYLGRWERTHKDGKL